MALSHEGQNEKAIQHFNEALRLQPDLTGARLNIAVALTKLARLDDAITAYEKFLGANQDNVGALNSLARLYLKHPDASRRNLQRTAELARHACDLTNGQDAYSLLTLAAVQMETGDLSAAIKSAESALELARAAGRLKLAQEAQSQLDTLRAASAQPSTR